MKAQQRKAQRVKALKRRRHVVEVYDPTTRRITSASFMEEVRASWFMERARHNGLEVVSYTPPQD